MERPEFMKLQAKDFVKDIRDKYDITSTIYVDGYLYCKMNRGMYGLKQAAWLVYNNQKIHLSTYGYYPNKVTTKIWSHKEQKSNFCLCVDNFRVQCFSRDDANHSIQAL